MLMNQLSKAGIVAFASTCLIAVSPSNPKITIQPLHGKEIPEGAISLAYFIEEPKGKGCAWAGTPWVIASCADGCGVNDIVIRINGHLHILHSNGKGFTGPKVVDGRNYRSVIEWSNNDVRIEVYENIVEETDRYRCTKGLLIVHSQGESRRFQLWGLYGCE
jgi:hypothetical protein